MSHKFKVGDPVKGTFSNSPGIVEHVFKNGDVRVKRRGPHAGSSYPWGSRASASSFDPDPGNTVTINFAKEEPVAKVIRQVKGKVWGKVYDVIGEDGGKLWLRDGRERFTDSADSYEAYVPEPQLGDTWGYSDTQTEFVVVGVDEESGRFTMIRKETVSSSTAPLLDDNLKSEQVIRLSGTYHIFVRPLPETTMILKERPTK